MGDDRANDYENTMTAPDEGAPRCRPDPEGAEGNRLIAALANAEAAILLSPRGQPEHANLLRELRIKVEAIEATDAAPERGFAESALLDWIVVPR